MTDSQLAQHPEKKLTNSCFLRKRPETCFVASGVSVSFEQTGFKKLVVVFFNRIWCQLIDPSKGCLQANTVYIKKLAILS